ncbi:MAG TPA: CARDB domain-containing protein, partial [Polyangiaceae bacterium]|nr:CARDB domain-containing protein [Polyangiaceae bacterium]
GDVEINVENRGGTSASDIVVRIYAGDPSSGGELLGEALVAGPLEPGDSITEHVDVGPLTRDIRLWAWADPADSIAECTDANNLAEGPLLNCNVIPR